MVTDQTDDSTLFGSAALVTSKSSRMARESVSSVEELAIRHQSFIRRSIEFLGLVDREPPPPPSRP